MARNTLKLLPNESRHNKYKVTHEYWIKVNQKPPLRNKMLIVMDEIFGPMIAELRSDGRWKAHNAAYDPEDVKYYIEFEHPR